MDIATHCARIYILAAGGGRFIVEFEGQTILTSARDPEHEACRELLGRGIRGRLESYIGGKHSMTFDIERAAGLSVSDGASSPLRITSWRPFDEQGTAVAVSKRAVETTTGKLIEAAI